MPIKRGESVTASLLDDEMETVETVPEQPQVVHAPKPEPHPQVVQEPKPEPQPQIVQAPKPEPQPQIVQAPKPQVVQRPVQEKPQPQPRPIKEKPQPQPKVIQTPKPEPKPFTVHTKAQAPKEQGDNPYGDYGVLQDSVSEYQPIQSKHRQPRATGRTAEVDLSKMSTGALSEMAGRNFVSEDTYKKSKRKWLIAGLVLVLLVGGGAGWYIISNQKNIDDQIAELEAQKKATEDKLKDLEGSEKYLKEELDGYMSDKAYNRALQVVSRIRNEYPDTDTDKYAQDKAKEARDALEKLGISEATEEDEVAVNYEDYKSVSYDKIATKSKDYRGQKIKIYGKILQIEDGKDAKISVIRIAVDDDNSKQIVAQFEKKSSIKVEEGDYVNVGGILVSDLTFKTALGKTTLPAMSAVYVDKIVG